jgi:hypothetical protein
VLMQLWMEYWEVFHMSMNLILVAVMISWRLSYLNVFLLMLKPNHSLLLVFFFFHSFKCNMQMYKLFFSINFLLLLEYLICKFLNFRLWFWHW